MENQELQLAHRFIHETRENIFLTGKAGTGKTTFLHQIRKQEEKRMVVCAPTGVAAINASGVTLHSLFQLPFGPNFPGSDAEKKAEQRRFNKDKVSLIRSLDLLVIDEVSMVRADLLDGVDAVLRRYRRDERPFGGVQLLMIGDLHQLAPIVRDDEWSLLRKHYNSCYFFSSHALQASGMITVELKHIYRQKDETFIALLNQVRNGTLDTKHEALLRSRYQPDDELDTEQSYITLSSHNESANDINDSRLEDIEHPSHEYHASIEGSFPKHAYPTESELELKVDSQVMFVKNDTAPSKLYFNGKIGRVTSITKEGVKVKCAEDGIEVLVEPATWENRKYVADENTGEIKDTVIGKFTQLPLRLAWAITIHKSQGLTFDHAIIDAGQAFAPGQVYVALSRCRTLDGIILRSMISQSAIITDPVVTAFAKDQEKNKPNFGKLKKAKALYQQELILEAFDYRLLGYHLAQIKKQCEKHQKNIQLSSEQDLSESSNFINSEIISVGQNFKAQLSSLYEVEKLPSEQEYLQTRISKATNYFTQKHAQHLSWIESLSFDTDDQEVKKSLKKHIRELKHQLKLKQAMLETCSNGFQAEAYQSALKAVHASNQRSTKPSTEILEAKTLKEALKKWRQEKAQSLDLEAHRVIHLKTIAALDEAKPQSLTELQHVKGIGKILTKKYGQELVSIITKFSGENGLEAIETISGLSAEDLKAPAKKPQRNERANTKNLTLELFNKGMSIKSISEKRNLATSTIEGHLAHFVGLGQIPIHELLPENKLEMIKETLSDEPESNLTNLKRKLGEDVTYSEITMVKNYLQYTAAFNAADF